MKDPRLVELKLRAEKDKEFSDGAHRSLALIISQQYVSRDLADGEFPLPWSLLSYLRGGLSRATAERHIREIIQRGYLKKTSRKGCPGTCWYIFVLRGIKIDASGCGTNEATERVKSGASGSGKNGAHHKFISLRDKNIKKRSASTALSAKAAVPTRVGEMDAAIIKKHIDEMRSAAGRPRVDAGTAI